MLGFRWFLFGIATMCAAALIVGWIFISGAHGFSAREQPTAVESWLAHRARDTAMPDDARSRTDPVSTTPDSLTEGRAHWADHCAVCHDNDGSGNTQMGKGMYPPVPDMRGTGTQQMTDGELFYVIQNGVRMSGMPAWSTGSPDDEEDSWKLVQFIRHLPQVGFEEKKRMEKLNPKGPDDRKEDEDEQKFLNGEVNNAPQAEHHHHH